MFLLVLSAAAVLQQPAFALPPRTCRDLAPVQTANQQPAAPRKLAEMPPGRLMHAVLRSVGGCEVVEVLSQGRVGPGGMVSPGAWVWEPTGAGRMQRATPMVDGR